MEVAETEEDGLDLGVLIFNVLLGEEGEGTLHVGLETLRGLVSELDGSLEDTNGDFLAGIGREIESEVGVGALSCIDIQFLLKILEEGWHEMDVLEHDPVALLVADFKFVQGNDVLTLTQGNLMKVLVGVNSIPSCEYLNILDGVGSG